MAAPCSVCAQIVVDPKVMRHLDALGLGMEKKKVERGRKLRLYKRYAFRDLHYGVCYSTMILSVVTLNDILLLVDTQQNYLYSRA